MFCSDEWCLGWTTGNHWPPSLPRRCAAITLAEMTHQLLGRVNGYCAGLSVAGRCWLRRALRRNSNRADVVPAVFATSVVYTNTPGWARVMLL
jgi:hypothetical protein